MLHLGAKSHKLWQNMKNKQWKVYVCILLLMASHYGITYMDHSRYQKTVHVYSVCKIVDFRGVIRAW